MTEAQDHREVRMPPPTLEEVSPDIYAYIQLDGSWGSVSYTHLTLPTNREV